LEEPQGCHPGDGSTHHRPLHCGDGTLLFMCLLCLFDFFNGPFWAILAYFTHFLNVSGSEHHHLFWLRAFQVTAKRLDQTKQPDAFKPKN
jgi:hypothetical protein